MARKSEEVLAAVDEDLQKIWCTARKEYDMSEHDCDMRRESLRRLELIMRFASMDPKEAAMLTLI